MNDKTIKILFSISITIHLYRLFRDIYEFKTDSLKDINYISTKQQK
jgi:hypothetical protein